MDLRRQLDVLRAWWKAIVAATLLAGVGAFALSALLPKVYQGEARLLVGQALQSSGGDATQFQSAIDLAGIYAEVAMTRPVLERVMQKTGIDELTVDFAKRVSVSADRQQPFVDVVASDGDPDRAAAIANAIADELVALSPSVSGGESSAAVKADIETVETQLAQARDEIERLTAIDNRTATQQARLEALENRSVQLQSIHATLLGLANAAQQSRVTVVEPAVAPDGPASPRPLFNSAIGIALGLLLSIALAFLWERLDDRVRTPEDVERVTGLSTLTTVIEMPADRNRSELYRLAAVLYPRSPAAEAFRTLRTNVEFALLDEPVRTLVVTSSRMGEGKTVVAGNLAVVFAQAGKRTLLVDADLRRPGVHALFSLAADHGLTDLIRSDGISVDDVAQATEVNNLRVITSGAVPANPSELLASQRMALTIDRLAAEADVVIIDTPPVGAVTDAALLAARAEATIFVVHARRGREAIVARAREALAKVNARVIGAVLNGVRIRLADHPEAYYSTYAPARGAAIVEPDEPAAGSPARPRPPRSVHGEGAVPRASAPRASRAAEEGTRR